MSLGVLASGTIVRAPEVRKSAGGKDYVIATLRASDGDDSLLVGLITWSSTVGEQLLARGKGDPIAVIGRARLRTWAGADGAEKSGLSIVAEQVISPYQLEKRRRRATAAAEGEEVETARRTAAAELERVARAQAAAGTAQVLTTLAGSTTARLAEMTDDVPF